ncbi:hypothetical protein EOT10_33510 [Streptomyces antnestii]|uniref:Uncharacterized protein n=1 Tax=Streptomyces antnestii TaxID=2494256 RepID=A0A437P5P1_9ACTN|nr:hypothetical protein [Streptomyces sp. San01]RVU17567.1 hypothetical protein EOT10_33510 [Streptomyces sp. San01]
MGGMDDKRQEPGKGREEQKRPSRPDQDPAHPESPHPSRSRRDEDPQHERRREENQLPDERDLRDEDT